MCGVRGVWAVCGKKGGHETCLAPQPAISSASPLLPERAPPSFCASSSICLVMRTLSRSSFCASVSSWRSCSRRSVSAQSSRTCFTCAARDLRSAGAAEALDGAPGASTSAAGASPCAAEATAASGAGGGTCKTASAVGDIRDPRGGCGGGCCGGGGCGGGGCGVCGVCVGIVGSVGAGVSSRIVESAAAAPPASPSTCPPTALSFARSGPARARSSASVSTAAELLVSAAAELLLALDPLPLLSQPKRSTAQTAGAARPSAATARATSVGAASGATSDSGVCSSRTAHIGSNFVADQNNALRSYIYSMCLDDTILRNSITVKLPDQNPVGQCSRLSVTKWH